MATATHHHQTQHQTRYQTHYQTSEELDAQLTRAFEQRQQKKATVTEDELRAITKARRQALGLHGTPKPVRGDTARRTAARRSRGDDAASRRRRALCAKRALPYRLGTDIRFTDAFFIVLEFHYKAADEQGYHRVSLPEITNRLKLSRSTVMRAHDLLESEGLVTINRRRMTAHRNHMNVYRLGEELLRGRPARHPRTDGPTATGCNDDRNNNTLPERGGVMAATPKEESIYPDSTRHRSVQESGQESAHKSARSDRGGREPETRPAQHRPENTNDVPVSMPSAGKNGGDRAIAPPNEEQLRLLRQANTLLDAEQPPGLTPHQLLERAEALIMGQIPLLYTPLWRMGLRRHGFRAVMAVFETILLTRTGHVHTPHGYLWGILRKPRGQIAPEISLGRCLVRR